MTTGASPAHADGGNDTAAIYIDSPSAGAALRGPTASLTVYFDTSACLSNGDTGQWYVDGHPVGPTVMDEQYPSPVGPGPGMPPGSYVYDTEFWDSTSVSDGQHTAMFDYHGRHCTDDGYYDEQVSSTFTVNNRPIGIAFSLRNGASVHGREASLGVGLTPQGSPITRVVFGGDVLDTNPDSDIDAPYATKLAIGDVDNGTYTVTATATDAAGIVTAATLHLKVDNHSTLTVRAPSNAQHGQTVKITIISGQQFSDGQNLLLEQRVNGRWKTLMTIHLSPSGRKSVSLPVPSRGTKAFRFVAHEGDYWPGQSRVFTIHSR